MLMPENSFTHLTALLALHVSMLVGVTPSVEFRLPLLKKMNPERRLPVLEGAHYAR
jgi:glutathione S-transferase